MTMISQPPIPPMVTYPLHKDPGHGDHHHDHVDPVDEDPQPKYQQLRRRNVLFGTLHLMSGIAMVALANDFTLPVSTTYLDGIPGGTIDPARLDTPIDIRLGWATAAFLFMSAIAHFVIAAPGVNAVYNRELERGQNRFRWVEYSLSSSHMIVLIAMLTGISDAAALLAIAGANAAMILFGWLMETTNDVRGDTTITWTPFWFGCIAGAVPWVAIGIYLFGPGSGVPNFVYGIFFSLFVFFNCFAVNQALQYSRVGKWKDYLFGERVYITLSITAKSILAWQIFANTLV